MVWLEARIQNRDFHWDESLSGSFFLSTDVSTYIDTFLRIYHSGFIAGKNSVIKDGVWEWYWRGAFLYTYCQAQLRVILQYVIAICLSSLVGSYSVHCTYVHYKPGKQGKSLLSPACPSLSRRKLPSCCSHVGTEVWWVTARIDRMMLVRCQTGGPC